MTITFRCVLILVSLFTLGGIVRKVRNAKVQIENTIFWILFGVILLILSIFPQIATLAAKALGIYSTTNFIFLFIIDTNTPTFPSDFKRTTFPCTNAIV